MQEVKWKKMKILSYFIMKLEDGLPKRTTSNQFETRNPI